MPGIYPFNNAYFGSQWGPQPPLWMPQQQAQGHCGHSSGRGEDYRLLGDLQSLMAHMGAEMASLMGHLQPGPGSYGPGAYGPGSYGYDPFHTYGPQANYNYGLSNIFGPQPGYGPGPNHGHSHDPGHSHGPSSRTRESHGTGRSHSSHRARRRISAREVEQGPPGVRQRKAVDWARKHIGLNEQDNPDVIRSFTNGRLNNWCADFISTAFEETGGSPWGHKSRVADIRDWGVRNDRYFSHGNRMPKPGDVAILNSKRSKSGLHAGIVSRVENGFVYVIEGNSTRESVREQRYRIDNSERIDGFVRPFGPMSDGTRQPVS